MLRIVLSLLLLLALPGLAFAAEPTRVKVTLRSGEVLRGELVSFQEGNYRIRTGEGTVVVAARRVARVDLELSPGEVCASEEQANERALAAARATLPKGLFAAIAGGKLLGTRPSLSEARELVQDKAPKAAHCLVFRVGEEIPREVGLGASPSTLNVGKALIEALGGDFRQERWKEPELVFRSSSGELTFRSSSMGKQEFTLPLLLGPPDGRLEVIRLRVNQRYAGALTIPYAQAVRAGLFRHALPGRVELVVSKDERYLARPVRVRVAMGGLDLDRELVAHVLPPVAAKPVAKKASQDAPIDVSANQQDLRDVMDRIGRQVGRNILVDPNVSELVTVELAQIPWREAVRVIAKMTRCDVEERAGGILLLTQPPQVTLNFHQANVRTVIQLLAAYSGKNVIVANDVKGKVDVDFKDADWIVALRQIAERVGAKTHLADDVVRVFVPKAGVKEDLPESGAWEAKLPEGSSAAKVNVSAKDKDLRDVVDGIARAIRRPLIVEPDVSEKVTVSLEQVAWPEALRVVAKLARCTIELREGAIVICQPPKITVQFTDANARTVIELVAAYSGKTVDLSPKVTGTLTLDLKEVDWRVALREISAVVGAQMELTDEGAKIVPLPEPVAPGK